MAIQWKPFSPKALDFIKNSNAKLNIAHGAVRSSKTVSCTVRFLTEIINGPPGDLAILSRTTATLQRNVLNDLQDLVGPKHFKWVNRQSGELRVFNRRIWLFGANNEDAEAKLRGATFAGALCDEVTLYPQSVWMQLLARCSVPDAKIFANTNPDNPYHWFHTEFIQNDKIKDIAVWHFQMSDNLSLSPEYIESLKQMYSGVWYDRMVLGLWVAAEGRIYDMVDPGTHYKSHDPNDPIVKYFVACDYGTSSVMTWGLYGKTQQQKIYKVDEYYYDAVKENQQKTDGMFAQDFKQWLLKERPGKNTPVSPSFPTVIYVDPSAASWKAELNVHGYNVQNANNDVINGIRHVGSMLSSNRYFIDPQNCPNTIREQQGYVWDREWQLRGQDKPLKVNDHTCDTDRYALYTESLYGDSGVYTTVNRR
jgi:PBSX family phage terminase large subunit